MIHSLKDIFVIVVPMFSRFTKEKKTKENKL